MLLTNDEREHLERRIVYEGPRLYAMAHLVFYLQFTDALDARKEHQAAFPPFYVSNAKAWYQISAWGHCVKQKAKPKQDFNFALLKCQTFCPPKDRRSLMELPGRGNQEIQQGSVLHWFSRLLDNQHLIKTLFHADSKRSTQMCPTFKLTRTHLGLL